MVNHPNSSAALESPFGARRAWFWRITLGVIVLGVLTATRPAEQTDDSLSYAFSIQTGQELYHPHHLVFNPIVRLLYLGLSRISHDFDAVAAAQVHNAVWALIAVMALAGMVTKITGKYGAGFLAGLSLLVMRGFWAYSGQTEVYVPSLGCLALIVWMWIREKDGFTWRSGLIQAGLFALAVGYHQTTVLFAVPLAWWRFRADGNIRRAAMVLGAAGLFVSLGYLSAFLVSSGTWNFKWFVRYMMSYTLFPNPDWGAIRHFSPVGIRSLFSSQIWNMGPLPIPFRVSAGLFLIFFAGVIGINARALIRLGPDILFRWTLFIWLGVHFVFFLWWLPSEVEFFIVSLLPILLLIFLALRDLETWMPKLKPYILAGWIGVIGLFMIVNGRAIWKHHPLSPETVEADSLGKQIGKDVAVICDNTLYQRLRYRARWDFAIGNPQLNFYNRYPIPADWENGIRVISAGFSRPDFVLSGFSGQDHPREWFNFTRWLYRMTPASGDSIDCALVSGFQIEGKTYLRVDTIKTRTILPVFFAGLDSAGNLPDHPFKGWANGHAEILRSPVE